MSRHTASTIAFAAVLAAASTAGMFFAGSALADEVLTPRLPMPEAGPVWQLSQMSAADLKHDYVVCERATTHAQSDFATPAACAALYEELRVRVFGGNLDALLSWFREAWYSLSERR